MDKARKDRIAEFIRNETRASAAEYSELHRMADEATGIKGSLKGVVVQPEFHELLTHARDVSTDAEHGEVAARLAQSDKANKASATAEKASHKAESGSKDMPPAWNHAAAAEAHIEAAHAHDGGDEKKVAFHQAMAAGHAAVAAKGGAWNEDDHPRDENGRFA